MNEIAGVLFFAGFVAAAYFGLRAIGNRRARTEEEFERRVSEGPSGLAAAVRSLQGAIEPASKKAEEVAAELRDGVYRRQAEAGEGPESGESGRKGNRSQ